MSASGNTVEKHYYLIAIALLGWLIYSATQSIGASVFFVLLFVAVIGVLVLANGEESEKDKARAAEIEEQSGAFAGIQEVRNAGLISTSGVPFGWFGDIWLRYAGQNHLVTVGTPGSGKLTTVMAPALLDYRGSCLVVDTKGEAASITAAARGALGNDIYLLNPFGLFPDTLDESAHFNPLHHLDYKSLNFDGDIRSLAFALIVDTGGKDSHWADSARELVSLLIMYVCVTKGEIKTLPRVRSLLMLPFETTKHGERSTQESGFSTLVQEMRHSEYLPLAKLAGLLETPKLDETSAQKSDFPTLLQEMRRSKYLPLAELAGQFMGHTEEMQSIFSTARTQTAWLGDKAMKSCLSGSDFDFSKMRREKMTVYVILPAKHLEAQARWLRLVITSAIDALTDEELQPGDSRVLFMLDEFAQLGRLPAIEKALGLVRGYGIQLWPFLQDLNQLKEHYPKRWLSFISTAGIAQFFACNDPETIKFVMDRAGEKMKKRHTQSQNDVTDEQRRKGATGESSSEAEQWEPLLKSSALYHLPMNEQIVFTGGSKYTFRLTRKPYWEIEDIESRAGENPYYKFNNPAAPSHK